MPGDFYSIGNLAFYDGWSSNYVYFNTLLNNGAKYENGLASWDPTAAAPVANQAVTDAQSGAYYGLTEEDSISYFYGQFAQIILFLKQAFKYEQGNEKAYFAQKLKVIKSTFTPEEMKTKPIADIIAMFKNGQKKFNYGTFITAINVMMQGIDNARAVANHESKRINEINKILTHLMRSRASQTRGIAKKKNKSIEARTKSMEESIRRLNRKVVTEYVTTKQLGRKKKDGKYAIFGGKQFATKIEGTIATVLGRWVENVLNEIIDNPKTIQSILATMQTNYPIQDGNFKHLSSEIRELIILAIIQYGMSNLNTVLNKELDDNIQKEVESALIKNTDLFDTVGQYNIKGLDGTFGQKVSESKLFKDSETTADLMNNRATELFQRVDQLLQKEKKLDTSARSSYLVDVLEHAKSKKTNRTALTEVEEALELIRQVTSLQDEIDKLLITWQKKQDQDLEKTIYLDSNKTISINITIHNGEAKIDMSQLKALVKDNDFLAFKQFNPASLKTMIASLRRRASLKLKETLIDATHAAISDGIFSLSEQELITLMGKELETLTIDINGPTLAELMPGIEFRRTAGNKGITINWNGKNRGRNDMVVIEIKTKDILREIKTKLAPNMTKQTLERLDILEKKVQQAQEEFLYTFQQQSDEAVKSLVSSNDVQKSTKLKEKTIINMHRLSNTNEELAKKQRKVTEAFRNLSHFLKENGLESGTVAEDHLDDLKKKMYNTLQNSFQISTTVKSYNTYMNKLGFGGGSLGGNLDDQLARINDIFSNAGLTLDKQDIEWIRSAIINCFPESVVGEKNKNLIESYLGSLMAFALFDEGGAEENIISDFYKNIMQNIQHRSQSHADILHLYIVNGIYVPGSYVLGKTIEMLETDVIPKIQEIPTTMRKYQGAGVTIINHASEAMIPNRPISDFLDNYDRNAWAATGEAVASQVSIKILFLAGLLDIANTINKKLGQIQIPAN